MHIGNSACDYDTIKKAVKEIKETEGAVWFGLGDYGDYISFKDKRFDPESIAGDVCGLAAKNQNDSLRLGTILAGIGISQTNAAHKFLEPIKDKGIILLEGNHERVFSGVINPAVVLATYLGIPFGGYCCGLNIRILVGNENSGVVMKTLLHHFSGGGGKSGGRLNKAMDWAAGFGRVHLVAGGHYHKRSISSINRVGWDDSDPPRQYEDTTYVIVNGTALKTYAPNQSNWESRMMFQPSDLGFIKVRVWLERPELKTNGKRHTPRRIKLEPSYVS